ncbi:hypothetical protein C5613_35975 [Rhodococcus opacus]|uniref:Uncharacterized protein n=1 Tax=Rhodococcus opacus TaxID=37919 RepID=A0A2S8IPH4_RHOOP|nr:hypothetical protein C5613_35975 [Rhodococcus opacus]
MPGRFGVERNHAHTTKASDETEPTKIDGNRHPECKLWDLILGSASLIAVAVIIAVALTAGGCL